MNRIYRLFVFFVAIIYLLIILMLDQVTLLVSFKFLIFQAFIIFLPGLAFSSLYRNKINDPLFLILFSYGLGVIINIFLYFVLGVVDLLHYANFAMLALSILCSIVIVKTIRKDVGITSIDTHELFVLNILVMITLVTMFVVLTLPNLLPDQKTSYTYYVDSLWHIGNIVDIKLGLPIEDLRVVGIPMHYHFGMHVHIAMMDFFIGGGSVASTFYSFSQLGIVTLLICTMFALAKKCLNSNILAMVTTLLLFIIERNFLFSHIFQYPTGVGLALAFELLAIYYFVFILLDRLNEKMHYFVLDIIPLCLLLFGSLYAKAPMGVLLYCGCVITAVYRAVKTKSGYKNTILFVILITGLFYFLYSILFVSNDAGSSSLGLGVDFGRALIKESTFYQFLLSHNLGYNVVLRLIATLFGLIQWLFNLETLKWAMPMYVLGLFSYIRHPLKINTINFFMSAVVFGGLILNFCIRQDGSSEYYFYMAFAPLILLQAVYVLNRIVTDSRKSTLLVIMISAVSIFTSINSFTKLAITGGENLAENSGLIDTVQLQSGGDAITKKEYQGMVWLKNNTSKEDVILTDRSYFDKEDYPDLTETIRNRNYRYHYYSAFSERKNYLEGFAYQRDAYGEIIRRRFDLVDKIFNDESTEALQQVKNEGVKYVVVTKSIHPNNLFNDKVVFENSDIKIYKL